MPRPFQSEWGRHAIGRFRRRSLRHSGFSICGGGNSFGPHVATVKVDCNGVAKDQAKDPVENSKMVIRLSFDLASMFLHSVNQDRGSGNG
jgi:hypothetical protein